MQQMTDLKLCLSDFLLLPCKVCVCVCVHLAPVSPSTACSPCFRPPRGGPPALALGRGALRVPGRRSQSGSSCSIRVIVNQSHQAHHVHASESFSNLREVPPRAPIVLGVSSPCSFSKGKTCPSNERHPSAAKRSVLHAPLGGRTFSEGSSSDF